MKWNSDTAKYYLLIVALFVLAVIWADLTSSDSEPGWQPSSPPPTTTLYVPSNDPWDTTTTGYRECRSEYAAGSGDLYLGFENCLEVWGAVWINGRLR